MGFKNEVYPLEWICITCLSFSFPLEYFNSIVLILITFPVAQSAPSMKLNIASLFEIDLSLSYLLLLFISLPYFLSTLVQVCRKRKVQLGNKPPIGRRSKKRSSPRSHSHMSDEDEEEEDEF